MCNDDKNKRWLIDIDRLIDHLNGIYSNSYLVVRCLSNIGSLPNDASISDEHYRIHGFCAANRSTSLPLLFI
ncbi:hypothetical protein BLOT_011719, partial [Blomia tropicalis]